MRQSLSISRVAQPDLHIRAMFDLGRLRREKFIGWSRQWWLLFPRPCTCYKLETDSNADLWYKRTSYYS
jgi:hypothetical protein